MTTATTAALAAQSMMTAAEYAAMKLQQKGIEMTNPGESKTISVDVEVDLLSFKALKLDLWRDNKDNFYRYDETQDKMVFFYLSDLRALQEEYRKVYESNKRALEEQITELEERYTDKASEVSELLQLMGS